MTALLMPDRVGPLDLHLVSRDPNAPAAWRVTWFHWYDHDAGFVPRGHSSAASQAAAIKLAREVHGADPARAVSVTAGNVDAAIAALQASDDIERA